MADVDNWATWGIVAGVSDQSISVQLAGGTTNTNVTAKYRGVAVQSGDRVALQRVSQSGQWIISGVVEAANTYTNGDGNPAGTIVIGGWDVAPIGYGILNGTVLLNGVTNYPRIAELFPSWITSGVNITLPDMTGATIVGTASGWGVVSGSMSLNITADNLPVHTHSDGTLATGSENRGHVHYISSPGTNGSGGASYGGWAPNWDMWGASVNHTHGPPVGSDFLYRDTAYNTGWTGAWLQPGGPPAITWANATWGHSADHDHTFSAGSHVSGAHQVHEHDVTGSTGNNTTTATAIDLKGRYMAVRVAVRLG